MMARMMITIKNTNKLTNNHLYNRTITTIKRCNYTYVFAIHCTSVMNYDFYRVVNCFRSRRSNTGNYKQRSADEGGIGMEYW